MKLLIVLGAAILPVLILLIIIYRRDPQKEPLSQLLKAFLCGVFICVPVAFVEYFIQYFLFGPGGEPASLTGATVNAFFVAALPEETAKLLVLRRILRNNKYFDEYFDGIVYAVCVGLGFAAIENISYVLQSDSWATVAISRALLAVPGHYAFAVMMGYYYSLFHFVERSQKNAFSILLVPVMAHGVYDTLAMSSSLNPWIGGITFVVLIYFCIKLQKEADRKILDLIHRDRQR